MCLNHKSEPGCLYGDKCHFRHTEAGRQPSKKSEKSGGKGSVALLEETIQLGCVFMMAVRKKSILRGNESLGSNQTVKFSKATMRQAKIRIAGESFKKANLRSEFH